MKFNFKELQKKYTKPPTKQQKQQQTEQKLILKQDLVTNPRVLAECDKLEKDYVTYYNNNRYFYLHTDPQSINTTQKIKNDQFALIRKKYEISLTPSLIVKEIFKGITDYSPKKKSKKAEREIQFKHRCYLFRKTIKIIIEKMKKQNLTMQDIFKYKIFSNDPYVFGRQIFQAVKSGNDTKVWRLHLQNRLVVYSMDSTGKSLLIWACIRGYANIAGMLIEMGVRLNCRDMHNHSALYYAIHYKFTQCVKILLLHQISLNQEDIKEAQQDKKMKNIIQLSQSIMDIIRKMPFEKRTATFEDRLRQLG